MAESRAIAEITALDHRAGRAGHSRRGRAEDSPAARIAAGRSAYAAGHFAEALASFERGSPSTPAERSLVITPPRPCSDSNAMPTRSCAYREARERAGSALRTKIDYALGNTALALGDLPAALSHYDDCLASKAHGKVLDTVRFDAAINRRYAEEQAEQSSKPPESDDDPSLPSNRPQSKSAKPDGGENPSEDDSGTNGSSTGDGATPPLNRRAQRPGPGGAGSTSPSTDSPEGRLEAALKNIREARSRRPDDPLPATDDQRMDW